MLQFLPLPGLAFLSRRYVNMWHAIVTWAGVRLLHWDGAALHGYNGSDTRADFVYVLCILAAAWPER